jgi:predicted Zn-dependent peptidase
MTGFDQSIYRQKPTLNRLIEQLFEWQASAALQIIIREADINRIREADINR